ncbi:hypothetical protein D3C81_1636640 [compost metagenome]
MGTMKTMAETLMTTAQLAVSAAPSWPAKTVMAAKAPTSMKLDEPAPMPTLTCSRSTALSRLGLLNRPQARASGRRRMKMTRKMASAMRAPKVAQAEAWAPCRPRPSMSGTRTMLSARLIRLATHMATMPALGLCRPSRKNWAATEIR